ncbi:hypothetical protein A0J57_05595 [Sphingobium sp. 22B]|uniref:hypothetical protein n=1 Tax=Sphingobium TaxID=165695 RepID=UPI000784E471|nr:MULTISPECIES: hypothetical protein [Sphingobium]OAP32387.1 hypothetical protein A8O16_07710 [Sphingobium sp. 20006FA]KXU33370.1 hypothetical protein AXW74_01910 [Sphingobium sp. AM]KYC33202.1 hypothetical protein A0J57_05595 [Sphingobium sp. 22B]MCB4863085.1 hypothetical protein [Sphingobium sp. PNB]MEC6701473.1 hypothetical protein [Sphingobium sp. SJ10-10]
MSLEKDIRRHFDLDIGLRDAALDAENRPTRRMIANACINMPVEDAYYSVRELREAAQWVLDGAAAGKRKLMSILSNDNCDDFQRCIYFCLAGRGVIEMLDDLEWLETLLEPRGRVAGEQMRLKIPTMPVKRPYVADEPDGPMIGMAEDFRQGPSWWMDEALRR